ncbi:MAG: DUF1349 domain-containing protein, partial [Lactobacillaceae bacterium]
NTDLWQRTHYGFSVTNTPMFVRKVAIKNFVFSIKTHFKSNFLYDQCGIVVYVDNDNWAKFSSEFENTQFQRLGGVVTKSGYSDWATTDIDADIDEIYYRIVRRGNDFIVEASYNEIECFQLRIFNLNYKSSIEHLKVDIYGCSPQGNGFECSFTDFTFSDVN